MSPFSIQLRVDSELARVRYIALRANGHPFQYLKQVLADADKPRAHRTVYTAGR